MDPRQYDRKLGVKTVGLREWDAKGRYNRYEATPYRALEQLCKNYRLRKGDRLVDFGCGRGRVAFFLHHRFHVPVIGIEAHDKTYEEALVNLRSYRYRARHIAAPIEFRFGLAEQYEVQPEENRFYFFNPFSHEVFQKVMENIMGSVAAAPRIVEVILYYPLTEFKQVMRGLGFQLINKVKVPGAKDVREMFLIYRYMPHEDTVGNP